MTRRFTPVAWLVCLCLLTLSFSLAAQPGDPASRALELTKRFSKLEAAVPLAERTGPGRFADAQLALLRLRYVLAMNPEEGSPALAAVLADTERALDALEDPAAPGAPRTGVQMRAYISEIDDSVQPYLLYVPHAYSEEQSWPLLVFLHGYDPSLISPVWGPEMCARVLQEVSERAGAVLLMPYGRSNTEFMGIGEKDVLDTIGFTSREYRIDSDRVVLAGMSMGGSGAYAIACHYPDRFAGLAIFTGRVDYYQWMNVPKESLPRFKQIRMDTDYAAELLPNMARIPALIFHGTGDTAVSIGQSRTARDRLSALGQSVRLYEVEGASHFDLGGPEFIGHPDFAEFVGAARRAVRPDRFRYRTFTLKYPGAYWARIDDFENWGRVAEIAVETAADNLIRVHTENVAAFTLGPDFPEGFNPAVAKLLLNGEPADFLLDGPLLRVGPRPAEGVLRKTSSLCGPIREACSGPFAVIYPSGQDPESRNAAQEAVRLVREWVLYAQGVPVFLPDSAVTDDLIRDKDLILCGSPASNRIMGRIAGQLPFRIEEGRYVIGAHSFPSVGNGFQAIFPNPLNRTRYVLVVDGVPWGGSLPRNHKLDFLPDFIVYSAETEEDGALFPTNRWLCAGFFDGRWRVSEDSLWVSEAGLQPPKSPDTLDADRQDDGG
jgi:predicted esterase